MLFELKGLPGRGLGGGKLAAIPEDGRVLERWLASRSGSSGCSARPRATVCSAATAGAQASTDPAPWLGVTLAGAFLVAAAWTAAWRAWELRVRTPSGLWLRVEPFRRFLAESEAHHADEAAARGVFREYTAWAVARGAVDRWCAAVRAAGTAIPGPALREVDVVPLLARATVWTVVEPVEFDRGTSSGGGGFDGGGGGGSVGSGSGGGGGGSW